MLQINLEQSETREVNIRCEASDQKARIGSEAQLHARRIYDNFQRGFVQGEQHMAEEAVNTRGIWESQARENVPPLPNGPQCMSRRRLKTWTLPSEEPQHIMRIDYASTASSDRQKPATSR